MSLQNNDEPVLRQSYRKFLTASIVQVVVVRFFSLLYFSIFYRLIGNNKGDLGVLVILSIVLMSVGVLSDLGLYYAFMQWTLTKKHDFDYLIKVTMGGFWFYVLPLTIIVNIIIGRVILGSFNLLLALYVLNAVIYAFFNLVRRYVIAIMKVERTNLLLGSYSILNSVSVPVFYFFYHTLESVLFAWALSLIGAISLTLISLRHVPPVWNITFDIPMVKTMVIFGFPIFMTTLLRILGSQIDRFMVYIIFSSESLGVYTAMKRIVEILNEAVLVILAGLFPIFSKLFKRNKERGIKIFYSIFRLTFFIGIIVYPFFYINRYVFVHILVGTSYDAGFPELNILVIGQVIVSLTSVLENFALGFEKRLRLLIGTTLVIIIQVLIVIAFSKYGIIVVPVAFVIGKLVFLIYFMADEELRNKIIHERLSPLLIWLGIELAIVLGISSFISSLILQNVVWLFITLGCLVFLKPLKAFDVQLISDTLPSKIRPLFNVLKLFSKE